MVKCVLEVTHNGTVSTFEYENVGSLDIKPFDIINVNGVRAEMRDTKPAIVDGDLIITYLVNSGGVEQ